MFIQNYYKPKNHVRVVTSAALFDGHDAAINIMRRILQDMGVEVIHLGHNRSVAEVAKTILQEGVQGVALSSYQGGHMEYFKYMKDLLKAHGADYVKIFGGGGGVIVHEEKKELEEYGIDQIFHPDDGRRLGLEGMIEIIVKACDFKVFEKAKPFSSLKDEIYDLGRLAHRDLGLLVDQVELGGDSSTWRSEIEKKWVKSKDSKPLVLGITGTGGAGKSSLIDELLGRLLNQFEGINIGVVCVDPSKKKTGGSLLGDRIRMNSLKRSGVYMRSLASRGSGNEISKSLLEIIDSLKELPFDLIIAESSGIGQASSAITEVSDMSLYVMTSDFGAQSQLEKIDMIDFADFIAINKADRRGSEDALRDVKKQYVRSRKLFSEDQENLPVYLTQASQFNDQGVNKLFYGLIKHIKKNDQSDVWSKEIDVLRGEEKRSLISSHRKNYLSEISKTVKDYHQETENIKNDLSVLSAIDKVSDVTSDQTLLSKKEELTKKYPQKILETVKNWDNFIKPYFDDEFIYIVRGKEIKQPLKVESLSGTKIPRVVPPLNLSDWGDRYSFLRKENMPGLFPFTSGVFPLKRSGEDPTRQFAGEGPPERTNKRFHYLSEGQSAKRLSTAFDSVTLYGEDPDLRPDIYGKVGESGVSIASLDDMKRLYDGFDLCDPSTSVSMTINGPAPMVLAFFMNTAIDQQIKKRTEEKGSELTDQEKDKAKAFTLSQVRGTVQADILKEDQGQNTCIFSIDFALKMMGDIQDYFIQNKVKNFYSVSVSGYHIAEAGANPITQLALTLSNAFTYVEYYLQRGMKIDDFTPSLSFFFSNGLDPEYSVIGRVARRIWAIAMKNRYDASERSQKLKYHIQTSGRSLHAQEIQFNDIRTTLQALMAINDNCNSLHTNAYDEAITTPTEESVRRAQAIQMIINKELGATKNENSIQGSYFYEWLTDEVEAKVLKEFERINDRGGVLGAMETQYQRGKIQEESMYYEHLKHSGAFPVIGVNTYIDPKTLKEDYVDEKIEMARASKEEKDLQLNRTLQYRNDNNEIASSMLKKLKEDCLKGENIFESLMEVSRYCTLHQITKTLYEVGGEYRRNL